MSKIRSMQRRMKQKNTVAPRDAVMGALQRAWQDEGATAIPVEYISWDAELSFGTTRRVLKLLVEEGKVIADASGGYLLSETAAAEIADIVLLDEEETDN